MSEDIPENIQELPKHHPTRNLIAKQLMTSRRVERRKRVETDRDGAEYISKLGGLKNLFDFARNIEGSHNVLDIGSGTTRGINQLSKSALGQDLHFEATVLRNPGNGNLPNENIHYTFTERLKDMPDKSVGCCLGLFSVAYSSVPELAVKTIDRVLTDGGVFKGCFDHNSLNDDIKYLSEAIGPAKFEEAFKSLGYDVYVEKNQIYGPYGPPGTPTITAIKPGSSQNITAEELSKKDKQSVNKQLAEFSYSRLSSSVTPQPKVEVA